MTNNEIKFLEYLDKSVMWEKEKQIALKNATKPFDKDEILSIIEDFEIKKMGSLQFCRESFFNLEKCRKKAYSVFY